MNFSELTPRQSKLLLALISLDSSVSFFPDIGLRFVHDPRAFLASVRKGIERARIDYERNPEQVPDAAVLVCASLQNDGHPEQADLLVEWSRTAFLGSHPDQPALSAWDSVLNQWAYVTGYEVGADTSGTLDRLGKAYRVKRHDMKLDLRCAELRGQELSAWDLSMYARHGWDAVNFNDPLDTLTSMAYANAARDVWLEHSVSMSEAQRQIVRQGLEQTVLRLGIWMPGGASFPVH